jgi:hypothetical protein
MTSAQLIQENKEKENLNYQTTLSSNSERKKKEKNRMNLSSLMIFNDL